MYATAVDYNPKDSKSIEFFKIVQNKLHFAAHRHTAPEVIYERADSDKPFMGLTTFKGDLPVMSDVIIAKNYLKDEYKKYQVKTISPVEKVYLETLKAISNKIDDKAKSE